MKAINTISIGLPATAALLGLWLAAASATAGEARPEMILDLGDNITIKLVQIPAGKFSMGSPADEKGRWPEEGVAPAVAKGGKTQVEVTISKPFYMGVYEVTVDQYKQFSPKADKRGTIKTWGPGSPEFHQRGGIPFFNWSFEKKAVKSEQDGKHPALAVLAEDAQKFCEWLSEKTGKKVMLPTEAQWEYACRAGSTGRFSFGDKDEDLCKYGNYCDQSNTCAFPWQDKAHRDGFDKTAPVGSFKPNAWGLYDMHGNAWELCRGWYTQNYPAADTVDPQGPATGDRFVLRGGGWDSTPALCRSAVRERRDPWNDPHARSDIDGFRVIVEEEAQEQAAKGAAGQEQAGEAAAASERAAARSPAAAAASVLPELILDLGDNVTMKCVKIPAGKFMMGQALGEKSLTWNDKTYRFEERTNTRPQTEVAVGSFYMGVYEVTRCQYLQFTKPPANYPYFTQDNDNHPVLTSTIEDCGKFCVWLSRKTGKDVRLPTEAQWEYACRAGSTTHYYFGDDPAELYKYANYCDAACSRAYRHRDRQHNDGWDMTAPVGSLKPNAWGLYDMLGNAQEMCFNEGETAATLADGKGKTWPIRGGAWNSGWGDGWGECASATRSTVGWKWMHSYNEGFRIIVPVDPRTGEAALAPAVEAPKAAFGAPAGVLVVAATGSGGEVVDDAGASTGKAVTSGAAWDTVFAAALPAEGEAFTIWVRRQGGPIQLKAVINGQQQEKRWDWAKPERYGWVSLGRYPRADLGQSIVIIRGGGQQKSDLPRIDCVVFSADASAHPAGLKPDGSREFPPFQPNAAAPAEDATLAVDWDRPAGTVAPAIWGVNDCELFDAKTPSPRFQQFLRSLNLALLRVHDADMAKKWTDAKARSWDVAKIKAAFAGSTGYGNARIILNIPGWPAWLGRAGDGTLPRESEDEFVKLVGELVRVLRQDVKQPIAYWEVLNEADEVYEKAGKLDDLWQLHNRLFAEIKRRDPQAKVGGPAFTWPKPLWVDSFLKRCAANIDFVTWHTYASGDIYQPNDEIFARADSFTEHARFARDAVAAAAGPRRIECFLDEYNVKWSWDPIERRHGNNVGAVFQACVLRRMAALGLDGVTVWHAKGGAYGLIDGDDTIRATGRLYQLGARCLVGRTAAAVTGSRDLEALAVTRADGVRSLLLINRADHTLRVAGVAPADFGAGEPTVMRIDADGFGPKPWREVFAGTRVSLPGYSLTLLTADAAPAAGQAKATGGIATAESATVPGESMPSVLRVPDAVTAVLDGGEKPLRAQDKGRWTHADIVVDTIVEGDRVTLRLASPTSAVKRLDLRWTATLDPSAKLMCDAWERGYGDLEWKALDPKRVMPWYFLYHHKQRTGAAGVMAGPGAMCFWKASGNTIELHADVRSGGDGVMLGARTLDVCTVVQRHGGADQSAFAVLREFCRQMCPKPRLPAQPVYGFNNWYCDGGVNAEGFVGYAKFISRLSPDKENRPYAVIDDGWQGGPGVWTKSNGKFPSMKDMADEIRKAGARPGAWTRMLQAPGSAPKEWRIKRDPSVAPKYIGNKVLDPTVPEVRKYVADQVKCLRQWGYELIKDDYSTFEVFGEWGGKMGEQLTKEGWSLADRSVTTAEAIREHYRNIRDAAGDGAVIIGCNTIGHLAAGIYEVSRIGDDTSDRDWWRTSRMGINALAFRLAQHGVFFAADPDCVCEIGSPQQPWEKNRQWLDLVARSGAALFLSVKREAVNADQEKELTEALRKAAKPQEIGEPLDWMEKRLPTKWRLDGKLVEFQW